MTKLTMVPGADRGPLAVLVEDDLASCTARGLSPNTLQNSNSYPLRKVLLPFCERAGIHEPTALTSRSIDRLAGQLMDEGGPRGPLSRHSVNAYVRAINHFRGRAEREGEPVNAKAQLPRLAKAGSRCCPARRSRRWRTPPGRSGTSSSSAPWPTPACGWGSW